MRWCSLAAVMFAASAVVGCVPEPPASSPASPSSPSASESSAESSAPSTSPTPTPTPSETSSATPSETPSAAPDQALPCSQDPGGDGLEDQPIVDAPASVVLGGVALTDPAYTEMRCLVLGTGSFFEAGDTTNGFSVSATDELPTFVDIYVDGTDYSNSFGLEDTTFEESEDGFVVTGDVYNLETQEIVPFELMLPTGGQ